MKTHSLRQLFFLKRKKEGFTDIKKFAKKLTIVAQDADNFYDAYEHIEELLKEFVKLNK